MEIEFQVSSPHLSRLGPQLWENGPSWTFCAATKPHIRALGGRSSLELVSRLSQSAHSRLIWSSCPAPHQVFPLVLSLRQSSRGANSLGASAYSAKPCHDDRALPKSRSSPSTAPAATLAAVVAIGFPGRSASDACEPEQKPCRHRALRPLASFQGALVAAPLSVFPSAPCPSETVLGLPQTASDSRKEAEKP